MINYLALGDSYTIGESVAERYRWPNLLSKRICKATGKKVNITIMAKTGWTTDELITAIDSLEKEQSYDLVSLLIGVNNQYRDYPVAQYKKDFKQLLNMSLRFVSGRKERVFVVSIPDYGVTPFAENGDPDKIAREIDIYNNMAEKLCKMKGIRFVNITEFSRRASADDSMTADDGLHPSGKMYQKWVDKIQPIALDLLK